MPAPARGGLLSSGPEARVRGPLGPLPSDPPREPSCRESSRPGAPPEPRAARARRNAPRVDPYGRRAPKPSSRPAPKILSPRRTRPRADPPARARQPGQGRLGSITYIYISQYSRTDPQDRCSILGLMRLGTSGSGGGALLARPPPMRVRDVFYHPSSRSPPPPENQQNE